MPRILWRVIPQELELMRDECPDRLWHLLKIMGEIAQVLHGLKEHRHTVTIRILTAGLDQRAFRWTQQKMLDQLVMDISGPPLANGRK